MDFRNRFAPLGTSKLTFIGESLSSREGWRGRHVGRAFCVRGKFENADSGGCRVENAPEGAKAASGSGKHGVLICATLVSTGKDEQGQTKGSRALLGQLRLCPLNTEGHLLFCFRVTTWPAFTEMSWLPSAAPLRAELGLHYLIVSYDWARNSFFIYKNILLTKHKSFSTRPVMVILNRYLLALVWSSSLFWRKMGAITIHKLTWCSSTLWNLYATDTESWASKGQENKTKLNYHLSVSYTYFALFV